MNMVHGRYEEAFDTDSKLVYPTHTFANASYLGSCNSFLYWNLLLHNGYLFLQVRSTMFDQMWISFYIRKYST